MGTYLNPGSTMFRGSLQSQIYVDKSGLIDKTNAVIGTEQKYICVSRPRRFGKTMAVNMLASYYGREENAENLFADLKISKSPIYREHLNQYDVIRINMQEFLSAARHIDEMLYLLQMRVKSDLKKKYPEYVDESYLVFVMQDIFSYTNQPFVILIDEWDCLFREYRQGREAQKKYLDFLRAWLKDKEYAALVYMTGILPIKKYGTHSALNMFSEYSMIDSGNMAEFFGFNEDEVKKLCSQYQMDFEETKAWYDGYQLTSYHQSGRENHYMYCPKSVVECMLHQKFYTYWNQTETYEALKTYIQMDMDGLRDAVTAMLGGNSVRISTGTFSNDMTTFAGKDDVLTLLVHLGYLTYDRGEETVSIPNKEVSQEYVHAITAMNWREIAGSIEDSRRLLESLWKSDQDAVAEGIECAHKEISILQYNDENSLSCTIHLAFYSAREYYTMVREFPAGKGFADICLIPRKMHMDKPSVVIELKWNKSAEGAIAQIKDREYVDALKDYKGNLILAGINYNRKTKKHTCVIEKMKV